jgi:hypothetical protein
MNIFYLHHAAPIAARHHCDKHVGKMLIESCQLLATAHHVHDNGHAVTYKPTHKNHPSAIWTRSSPMHYMWLVNLAVYLGREFWFRYGKVHACRQILIDQLLQPPPALLAMPKTWQPPTLAMPDEFKCDDAVQSYRRFYTSKQDRMPMVWYRGEQPAPDWFVDYSNARMAEA